MVVGDATGAAVEVFETAEGVVLVAAWLPPQAPALSTVTSAMAGTRRGRGRTA